MTLKFISRLRSRREVQDQLGVSEQAAVGDGGGSGGECCCWNKLPPELLREVLLKIEDSETCWPQRKTVVACAGVCKSWRLIIKEIVQIPEFSRKLTFPISVKQVPWSCPPGNLALKFCFPISQPGPNDGLLHCFIKRNRSTRTYYLYLGLTNGLTDDGKFLLAARKCRRPTCTDYIISLQAEDMLKGSCAYVGKLRSNYIGNRFTILDGQSPHTSSKMAKNDSSRSQHSKQASSKVPFSYYPMAHISYELDVFGSRGPRRMQCIMETIPAKGAAQTRSECSRHDMDVFQSNPIIDVKPDRMCNFRSGSLSGQKNDGLVLINKAPRWHEQLHCWCLNFHGRVTVASVKNFQLVASPENEKIILQFGKVGKDIFTMDYQYPISAFQAFSICLSSFDTKIACE